MCPLKSTFPIGSIPLIIRTLPADMIPDITSSIKSESTKKFECIEGFCSLGGIPKLTTPANLEFSPYPTTKGPPLSPAAADEPGLNVHNIDTTYEPSCLSQFRKHLHY